MKYQSHSRYYDEYAGDDLPEYEANSGESESYDADRPIPVRFLFHIEMRRRGPGDA